MSEEQPQDYLFKIVIIGDSNVGKTNLLLRFSRNEFVQSTKPTIGVDYFTYEAVMEERRVTAHFWDTAGQEKFRGLTASYYKNCHGAIFVFDVTSRASFDSLNNWLEGARALLAQSQAVMLLLGNKSDLAAERQVSAEEADAFAARNGLFYAEVSAKTNADNCVGRAFQRIVREVLALHSEERGHTESLRQVSMRRGKSQLGSQRRLGFGARGADGGGGSKCC